MSIPDSRGDRSFHPGEEHTESLASRLNWLRAGVLGANDGIVSVAAVMVGMAGATEEVWPIIVAGAAAVLGGAISMALGEYVSVSSQKDAQEAMIVKERHELETMPEEELEELTGLYQDRGLSRDTAELVARELTAKDALSAHLETELHLNQDDIPSPWSAAGASAVAFLTGAALPFLMSVLLPVALRVPLTFVAVVVALALTGAVGAWLGGARPAWAALRTVVGGALALTATWLIGTWLGTGMG
ncbi:MAG: VIT1/CCC1 transporter family protein [Galactobacter sp.]|uniref:VIT1/CCC1 transporter family protein n=1 Tax=Galactobacter sp. TaxID=2676125 RepID=UPI0025BB7EF2|nr:VIT family protein [Galactobacter sp.]